MKRKRPKIIVLETLYQKRVDFIKRYLLLSDTNQLSDIQ